MFRILPTLTLLAIIAGVAVSKAATPDIIPVSEITRGMKGEWRTVVSGTEIETFELEVLDIASDFVGPDKDIIICKATSESQIISGPVSGMSGSPVYFNGKLAGAYAYGFTWPKEQTIIGVTPIEEMLKVLDYPRELPSWAARQRAASPRQITDTHAASLATAIQRGGVDSLSEAETETLKSLLKPVPMPVFVSGVSAEALSPLAERARSLGLDLQQAPLGQAGAGFEANFEPGSPVAGVLLGGDFKMAGVGTITWRDGDTILGFGHPFFGWGPVDMPMAGAEVITVVQTLPSSFKLSNVGPTVGRIFQDRQSAIAGTLGEMPTMAQVLVNLDTPIAQFSNQGEMYLHPGISPFITAVALFVSLQNNLENELEQTYEVTTTIQLEDHEPLILRDTASGADAVLQLVFGLWDNMRALLDNPFEVPTLEKVQFDVKVTDGTTLKRLQALRFRSASELYAGEVVRVDALVRDYRGETTTVPIEVPLPDNLKPGAYTLLVADAKEAERLTLGMGRQNVDSFDDVLHLLRNRKSTDQIYLYLLSQETGLRVSGQTLEALPPSIAALYTSPKNIALTTPTEYRTVWKSTLPQAGPFMGSYRITFNVLP